MRTGTFFYFTYMVKLFSSHLTLNLYLICSALSIILHQHFGVIYLFPLVINSHQNFEPADVFAAVKS